MCMEETKFFFSYSRNDKEFVLKLAKELRSSGISLWLDQIDILGGQRWDRAIEEALKSCQGMIAVLSPASLGSENVMDEVSYALDEDKLILPILLRPCNIPFRLRRVQHIDFTVDYEMGFSQLLKALRNEHVQVNNNTHEFKEQTIPEITKSSNVILTAAEIKLPKEQIIQNTTSPQDTVIITQTKVEKVRLIGSLFGAFSGAIYGTILMLNSRYSSEWYISAMIVGIAGMIIGAIIETHRSVIVLVIAGMIVGLGIGAIFFQLITAAIFWAPGGALLCAISGAVIKNRKKSA